MVRKGSPVRVRHWASMVPSSESSAPSPEGAPSPDGASRDDGKPSRARRMAEGLQERRRRHLTRSRPHRIGIVILGFLITLAGLVMTGPIPGPGTLIIPIGLALLALEFAWAERLLQRALRYAEEAGDRASALSTRAKVAIAIVVVLVLAAAVTAVIVFRPPPFS